MEKEEYFLVSSKILPPVIKNVLKAKELLASGEAANTSQAAKMSGISRSAFYKYRDHVLRYRELPGTMLDISAMLFDRAGVFSSFAAVLYENGANIMTVNQGMPVDGAAKVSLTVQTDKLTISVEELLERLRKADGVISVKTI